MFSTSVGHRLVYRAGDHVAAPPLDGGWTLAEQTPTDSGERTVHVAAPQNDLVYTLCACAFDGLRTPELQPLSSA